MDVILIFLCACFAVANTKRIVCMVDLTYVCDEKTVATSPTVKPFERKVVSKGLDKYGQWFFTENFCVGSHACTHIDAPAQFCKRGWTVDKIPLTNLVCPMALINVCEQVEQDPDYEVQVSDLENWEEDSGCSLDRHTVMVHSCWGFKSRSREEYLGNSTAKPSEFHFPGMSLEAAEWLVSNRKVCGFGIDTISVDRGVSGAKDNFPVHRTLLCHNVYLLENVANLHLVPTYGATLYAMPMKIGGASGAPLRLLAEFKCK